MPNESDFACLIARVRSGDADAAVELVRRYESLVRVAVRVRVTDPSLGRLFDSHDICQSVLASFFVRAALGQFDLDTPDQLVGLLVTMAQNKLAGQTRWHYRKRRDVRRIAADGQRLLDQRAAPVAHEESVDARDLWNAFRGRLDPEELDLAERRGRGLNWETIATEIGGSPSGRRKQLDRAVARVGAELGLAEEFADADE